MKSLGPCTVLSYLSVSSPFNNNLHSEALHEGSCWLAQVGRTQEGGFSSGTSGIKRNDSKVKAFTRLALQICDTSI